jgi:citrate lyase subunit beta/citryl-CoA lyase
MRTPAKTVLSVPASSAKIVRRAASLSPRVVMLDLEDGVAAAAKGRARGVLTELVHLYEASPAGLWIRTNPFDSQEWDLDLGLIETMGEHLDAVVIPKASLGVVRAVSEQVELPIVALVETAAGVEDAVAISATPSVAGFMFGGLDYIRDLASAGGVGAKRTEWAEARMVNAAAAYGKWSVAGPTADLKDPSLLQEHAARQWALGFVGKLCIHPNQLATVERAFTPSDADRSWAEQVLAAVAQQQLGAIAVAGEMVDFPVIERARFILAAGPEDRA